MTARKTVSKNGNYIIRLAQSTLKVSIGAFGLKAAYFVFNAALANASDIVRAGEYLRIIAFLTAYSSVVHFSTAKYVSKQIVENSETAKGAFYMSLMMTAPGALLVTFLCLHSVAPAIPVLFGGSEEIACAYIFIASLFLGTADFLSLVGIGTGKYWRTVAAQLIKAAAFLLSAVCILYSLPKAYTIGLALPIISSLIGIWITFRQLVPHTERVVWPPFRTVVSFSLPLYLAGLAINPASMWIVNNLARLDAGQIVLYVAAQNIFGLIVLAAGQINTASFYFLAQTKSKSSHALKSAIFAIFTVCLVGTIVFICRDYLDYLYGPVAEQLKTLVPLLVLAALPFVANQIAGISFFVSGHPWLIAISASSYTVIFALTGYIVQDIINPMQYILLGLVAGYLAQLLGGLILFALVKTRR